MNQEEKLDTIVQKLEFVKFTHIYQSSRNSWMGVHTNRIKKSSCTHKMFRETNIREIRSVLHLDSVAISRPTAYLI